MFEPIKISDDNLHAKDLRPEGKGRPRLDRVSENSLLGPNILALPALGRKPACARNCLDYATIQKTLFDPDQ